MLLTEQIRSSMKVSMVLYRRFAPRGVTRIGFAVLETLVWRLWVRKEIHIVQGNWKRKRKRKMAQVESKE